MLPKLYNEVTPKYAGKWKEIGKKLDLPIGQLNAIEAEWPTNLKRCCNKMLNKWSDADTTASLEKIDAIIQSLSAHNIQASPYSEGE